MYYIKTSPHFNYIWNIADIFTEFTTVNINQNKNNIYMYVEDIYIFL